MSWIPRILTTALLPLACTSACTPEKEGPPKEVETTYPSGPYSMVKGGTAPDLELDGVDASGALTRIHLHDYLTRGDAPSGVLMVQVSGGLWCGTCRWYGAHASELGSLAQGDRVRRLDVVVGSRDNAPATAEDAALWRETFSLEGTAVAADPTFAFGAVLEGEEDALPLFVFIDTGTMRIVDMASNPQPAEWRYGIESALAEIDGTEAPEREDEALVDGLFARNEWDLLRETTVPGVPPSDPTNAVADSPAARALGKKLYFDVGLSPSGSVSCATCHDPEKHLSDGLPLGQGMGMGNRRTPAIGLSAHARWQFWDGRADSLWAQALGPLENPAEFDSSRVFVARRLATVYASELTAAFPDQALPDTSGWPERGAPGDAEYDSMSEVDRRQATMLFVDAGKAIAAYERTFRVEPNALDDYLAGELDALTTTEKYGLEVFVRTGCMQCHWGPRLTDDAFHDTRIPMSASASSADRGRIDGLAAWRNSEFRGDGPFSDAPDAFEGRPTATSDSMVGQFRTPALRGVADLDHWGHDGVFDGLASVTESYGRGGVPAGDPTSAGVREPWIMFFGETAEWALVPFLQTLKAEPIVP